MGVLLGVSTKTKHGEFHIIQQPIWLCLVPIIESPGTMLFITMPKHK